MTAPLDSAARPAAHIDLDAIARNWRRLDAGDAGDAGAVVKANGYGLGAAPIARRLIAEGCRAFFVATLDEGEQLRAALPAGPSIHVFNGLADGAGPRFLNAGLSPVLNSLAQVEAWAAARSARRIAAVETPDVARRDESEDHDDEDGHQRPGELELVAAVDLRRLAALLVAARKPGGRP